MNTDQLRHALETDIARYGDGSNIELSTVVARGRSRRRTSRSRRVVGSVAAMAVGGGAAFALAAGPAAATEWTLAAAPEQVNQQIVDLIEAELPAGTAVAGIDLAAFKDPEPGQGSDAPGGIRLAEQDWGQADAWRATVRLASGGQVVVSLGHARGETEGDAAANCKADLAEGYYDVCDAGTVTRQGEDVEKIWRTSAREFVAADGTLYGADAVPSDGPDLPDSTSVTVQELEAQPGGAFLVTAYEITPEGEEPVLDQAALADIALAEELLDAR